MGGEPTKEDKPMTKEEIVKALVQYRLIEDQKKELEAKQAALKEQLRAHMEAAKLTKMEENDISVSIVPRNTYKFDIPGILTAVPEAIGSLKLTNEAYEKLLVGNEATIGGLRQLVKSEKTLTIKAKGTKAS